MEAGDVMATLELDDPTRIKRATEYKDPLPIMRQPTVPGDRLNQKLQDSVTVLNNILNGYVGAALAFNDRVDRAIAEMRSVLHDPQLPLLELDELFAVLGARIPRSLSVCFIIIITIIIIIILIDSDRIGSN